MKTILILEDNDERIAGFQKAVDGMAGGFELKIWRDAHSMIAECEEFFPTAWVICLDHDLNPQPGATTDPGTGLDVAKFLDLGNAGMLRGKPPQHVVESRGDVANRRGHLPPCPSGGP